MSAFLVLSPGDRRMQWPERCLCAALRLIWGGHSETGALLGKLGLGQPTPA